MLEVEQVSCISEGKTFLHPTSFQLLQGEHAVLTGKSGAGKTTLLRILVGGLIPSTGSVRIHKIPLTPKTILNYRQQIAYIDQNATLAAENVREALLLPYTFRGSKLGVPPSDESLRKGLDRFQLSPDLLGQSTARLSGGERQRVAILRAVLLERPVFIVDEITASLDHESKGPVLEFFRQTSATVLSVSHDPDWLALMPRVIPVGTQVPNDLENQ